MSEGFVYILSSPNSPHVKIGGTEHPPAVRLKGVNSDAAYQDHGPWIVSDFLHVTDWREVERLLHTLNVGQQVRDIAGTRELFSIGIATARAQLSDINPALIVRRLELDRLFQLKPLALYLERMFRSAGLAAWIHTQGTWTLRLFPSTSGDRYFTLNIGAHETAYCTLPRGDAALPIHGLVVDKLICDFPEVEDWLKRRDGGWEPAPYESAYDRAYSLWFSAKLEDAETLFVLPGVRRALVAYWSEALIQLHERDARSSYARFHDYNAVAALLAQIRDKPLYALRS